MAPRRVMSHHDQHLFTPFELLYVNEAAGLRVERLPGDYDRSMLRATTPRLASVARTR